MKIHNKLFTTLRIVLTLFLLLATFVGCGGDGGDGSAPDTEKFTLFYDANGGEGEMDSQTAEDSAEITIAQNAFTRTDYNFTGWNTAADGSGASYHCEPGPKHHA